MITNDIEQTISIDVDKLRKQFPKIMKITKGKITKHNNTFEQEIILYLQDKKYIIKLILLNKDSCCAKLTNYLQLNQFRFPMQVTGTNCDMVIRQLISERYNNRYN